MALEWKKKEPAMIKITVKYTTCLFPCIYSADIFSVFGNMIIHWWARLAIYWKTDDWHLASDMVNSYTHWTACTNADRVSDVVLISTQWQQGIRDYSIVKLTSELEFIGIRASFKNITCLDWSLTNQKVDRTGPHTCYMHVWQDCLSFYWMSSFLRWLAGLKHRK